MFKSLYGIEFALYICDYGFNLNLIREKEK